MMWTSHRHYVHDMNGISIWKQNIICRAVVLNLSISVPLQYSSSFCGDNPTITFFLLLIYNFIFANVMNNNINIFYAAYMTLKLRNTTVDFHKFAMCFNFLYLNKIFYRKEKGFIYSITIICNSNQKNLRFVLDNKLYKN